ncbi:MAG: UDP-N-acetylmuramoyl-tripeptide--D-alanyl-D-alanine ligase [candidate division WOR-3 bacterium]
MFTVREIAFITGGRIRNSDPNVYVSDFTTDSRVIKQNSIFIAIKGEKFDGAFFSKEAIEKGALAVIVPAGSDIPSSLPRIEVDDPVLAMAKLANHKLRKLKTKIIGVTGSVGKTTTKELIYSLLSTRFKVFKSRKSFNNHIGLPLTILEAPVHTDFVVLEYGTNHPGEIAYLTSIAKPELAIITRIGTAHIEFFYTQENIAIEKGRLFKDLKPGGVAFINTDTPYVDLLNKMVPYTCKKVTFGTDDGEVRPEYYEITNDGTYFHYKGVKFTFPLPGKGMLENVMGAMAIAEYLEVPLDDISNVLRDFKDEKMRMEKKEFKGLVFINDAYNANPDSMKELLETFKEGEHRLIFILGDMLELGDKAEEEHRKIGRLFVDLGHKILFTYGNLAGFISEEAGKTGLVHTIHFDSKDELALFLKNFLKPGDWIILKASRGIALEEVQQKLEEIL